MGLEFKLKRDGKTSKYSVNKNTGLYVAGAVTAVGLAAFLYQKLKDRVEFSVRPAAPPVTLKPAEITEMKQKLKEKEAHLTRGKTEHLERRIEEKIQAAEEKVPPRPKPPKPAPETQKMPPASVRALKQAVVEYVTEDIEDKLANIDISKTRLEKIVGEVHDRTEEILAFTDVVGIAGQYKTTQAQVAAIIRAIKPQLLEEMKKVRGT